MVGGEIEREWVLRRVLGGETQRERHHNLGCEEEVERWFRVRLNQCIP